MDYQQIINSADTVLVEFYANWCPHCRRMEPVVEQLTELLEGKANVVRLDIDRNADLTAAEHITTVPTFIVYTRGHEVWRGTGEYKGDVLLAKVEKFVMNT